MDGGALLYQCCGQHNNCLDETISYLWNQAKAGNSSVICFLVFLAIGIVLFVWTDATIPDASHDGVIQLIAFIWSIILILLMWSIRRTQQIQNAQMHQNITTNRYAEVMQNV